MLFGGGKQSIASVVAEFGLTLSTRDAQAAADEQFIQRAGHPGVQWRARSRSGDGVD